MSTPIIDGIGTPNLTQTIYGLPLYEYISAFLQIVGLLSI